MKKEAIQNKKKGKWFQSIASQISIMIAAVTLIVMLSLSVFAVLTVQNIITKRVTSEFNEIAQNNGRMVQHILQTAETSNHYIEDYHAKNYGSFLTAPHSDDTRSKFYNNNLSKSAYAAENYYVELMESTVAGNSCFDGMGVYFTHNAFDRAIENYSVYVYRSENFTESNPVLEYTYGEDYFDEEWFTQTVSTGQAYISEPYEEDGNILVSIATPLKDNNTVVGVSLVDIYTEEFSKIHSTSEDYPSMTAGVVNGSGLFMYNSGNPGLIGQSMKEGFLKSEQYSDFETMLSENQEFFMDILTPTGPFRTYCNPVNIAGQTWWSYTSVHKADMMAAVDMVIRIMLLGTAVSLIVLVGLSTMQIIRKLKPLKQLNEAADALLRGELNYKITYISKDEIGTACGNMKNAFQGLHDYIAEISHWMQGLEHCDLTVMPQIEFKGDFTAIQRAYISLIQNLNNSFQEIKVSADQINIGAEQISGAAQTLSQGSTEQAASVEQLSAMITDVTETIKENANGANQANALSLQVGSEITQSSQYMSDLMAAMDKITQTSNEVNKIIKTIDDIAFQTNILALNAAVEAARAGAAGKGFAVVADEVRNLAGKSAEAAKSTTALIESEMNAVIDGTKIANQTAESLKDVVSNVEAITAKVEEINDSSEKQSTAVEQINTGAAQISAVIQANSATSEESAAASEELAGQANMLNTLVNQFKLQ